MLYASLHRFSCQLVLTLLTIFEAAVPLLPAHSFAWNRAPPLLQWRPLIQRKQKDSNSTEPNSVKPTGPTLLNPSWPQGPQFWLDGHFVIISMGFLAFLGVSL